MSDTANTYSTVTPYLLVRDGDAELKFLETAFGGTSSICERRPDGSLMHAEIKIGDSLVMLGQDPKGRAWNAALYLWVGDVDSVYQKALAAGATSESAPADQSYGHRSAGVVDPGGVTWWIGAPVKQA